MYPEDQMIAQKDEAKTITVRIHDFKISADDDRTLLTVRHGENVNSGAFDLLHR